MGEKCIINNNLVVHLTIKTKESYKTELGRFTPLFSACCHQIFEGWICIHCFSHQVPHQVEEKVVNNCQSELGCSGCGSDDIYDFYTLDNRPEIVEPTLVSAFGDLDAAVFK